jgi:hypothetical protein
MAQWGAPNALFSGPAKKDIAKLDAVSCQATRQIAGRRPNRCPPKNLTHLVAGFLILGSRNKEGMELCPAV